MSLMANENCPLFKLCGKCTKLSSRDIEECWCYDRIPRIENDNIILSKHNEVEYKIKDTPENRRFIANRNSFCSQCYNNHCVGCIVLDFIEFLSK